MGLGPEKRNTAFMIDFGLARKYVFASGEIRPVCNCFDVLQSTKTCRTTD